MGGYAKTGMDGKKSKMREEIVLWESDDTTEKGMSKWDPIPMESLISIIAAQMGS